MSFTPISYVLFAATVVHLMAVAAEGGVQWELTWEDDFVGLVCVLS